MKMIKTGNEEEQEEERNHNSSTTTNYYYYNNNNNNKRQTTTWTTTLAVLLLAVVASTGASRMGQSKVWTQTYQQEGDNPPQVRETYDESDEGYIGCVFSDSVCNSKEICFDDSLFGQCVPVDATSDELETLESFEDVNENDKRLLTLELEGLLEAGYRWNDVYTQCIIQNSLAAIKQRSDFDILTCDDFLPNNSNNNNDEEEAAAAAYEQQLSDMEQEPEDFRMMQDFDTVVPKKMIRKAWQYPLSSPPQEDQDIFVPQLQSLDLPFVEDSRESQDDIFVPEVFQSSPKDEEEMKMMMMQPQMTREEMDYATYMAVRDSLMGEDHQQPTIDDGYEGEVGPSDYEVLPEIYWPSNDEGGDYYQADYQADEPNSDVRKVMQKRGMQQDDDDDDEDDATDQDYLYYDNEDVVGPRGIVPLMATGGLESSLFNRNERLDVKKPGPFYQNSANNFFLDKLLSRDYDIVADDSKNKTTEDVGQVEYEMPLLAPSPKEKRVLQIIDRPEEVEGLEGVAALPNFVHIGFKKRFDTYQQGDDVINYIAHEFDLPDSALSDKMIEDHHIQFHVKPNPRNIDAIHMAKRLDSDGDLKTRIDSNLGVNIDKAAAGHRGDVSSVLSAAGLGGANLFILVVASVSSLLAVLVVGAVLLLVNKRRSRVGKIRQQEVAEQEKGKAQDEYKQLCRDWSRSSKKYEGGKPNNPAAKKLSSNGSKDSNGDSNNQESSARSSTSSWPEEPNTSNMDISTGHMVLAYMEDHLKNKQRLEQEWVALCGYEAEPCATTIAFKAENKKKNRYPDKLPYDHNRIILNAMVNGTSSDYINASSVTDHDPRNPSYLVTQAPLANTVADFWQMVWEQGCVVIVMLTRLQDTGHQLCHRYWPEQGSEQYHIFEVHLVSEHIWCEDYLVRSVYLKNTRTGETRTVTQFHFRSWPANGVPTSTKALLEFRRKVNKSYRGRSCPIAVHCSDGVGRSGTYVLLDMVLNRMTKGCKEIDIAAALEHIRDQRGGMVKNKQQFEFCLMAVAEEVHAILKALPQ